MEWASGLMEGGLEAWRGPGPGRWMRLSGADCVGYCPEAG